MGSSLSTGGDIPDWVFQAMGEDPTFTKADPGNTYSFDDRGTTRCIPVFWNPIYLAKKKALIAMASARYARYSSIKIVGLGFANVMR